MRRAIRFITTALGIAVLCFVAYCSYPESPTAVFRRLVADPIPASVRNIRVSGYTGLTGSDQVVSFELFPEDFPKILVRRNFTEKRIGDLIHGDRMQRADFLPLDNPTFFEASELDGAVSFTIKTNPSRSIVYYHYFRL